MTRTRDMLAGTAGLVFVTVAITATATVTIASAQPAPESQGAPALAQGQGQSQSQSQSQGQGQALSLDRVRSGLRQELYIDRQVQAPTFRTEVEGHVITLKNYWIDDSTAVATYVHPTLSQAHGEYLNMMGSPVGATGRGPFARVNDPKQVIQVPMMMVDVTWLTKIGRTKPKAP